MTNDARDFLISYVADDLNWAEWIASIVEENGYDVIMQAWDFKAGNNYVIEMHKATKLAKRTIAVLSPNYMKVQFTKPEWAAAFEQDPTGELGKLIPIVVKECTLEGLLHQLVSINLVDIDEQEAITILLSHLSSLRLKPISRPRYPIKSNLIEKEIEQQTSWQKHLFQPKSLSEMIKTSKVVIDTNVLVSIFHQRHSESQFILDNLRVLSQENRLFIPPQVVKEFSSNHMKIIGKIYLEVERIGKDFHAPLKKPSMVLALLSHTDSYKKMVSIEEELENQVFKFHSTLQEIQLEIERFMDNDIVLKQLYDIIERSCFRPVNLPDDEILIRTAFERYKKKIPPGFLDKDKENENAAGDYIIWSSMLALQDDVLFVTNDMKNDWVVHKPVLKARRELVEEFYEKTGGKSIRIVSPLTVFQMIH